MSDNQLTIRDRLEDILEFDTLCPNRKVFI